ncbi:FAD-dependent thymidylate synthase [Neobacillus thermocopriae]|uniref:FAD-dependent thymidylate synthase n=1 Tax=Neobacillus thermocopriae TaxID=1215031 RepID=UPI002E1BE369|nr:FAD-dependent thymidylate synthase [Neobacillus thermocopriae]MED3623243.1 FAD-dependent thymidylate synthase [Neobacillus thermocopriae]MED3714394.1 FAD-dependent thymidylate synthase [Neobacillus thermocopriae]
MEVKLLAHTRLSDNFQGEKGIEYTDGLAVSLTAIRTCYSHIKPSKIVEVEGEKYFGKAATDGKEGTEAARLIRHIMKSRHTSTVEHLNFTFVIEGVSRSLLAQLTRHRHFSFSVQSQRYVKLESSAKSEGFDYVTPPSIDKHDVTLDMYAIAMERIQDIYDDLRKYGVPAEDARYILPNATICNLVLTGNLRAILEFYSKRASKHAQWEIRELSEKIKSAVIEVEPWTEPFFRVN